MDAKEYVGRIARGARGAARELVVASGAKRDAAIRACAQSISDRRAQLRQANENDLSRGGEFGLTAAMLDRLRLTDQRIEAMAAVLEQIASQVDPVGKTILAYNRPNGLRIEKRRVPIGVIAVIYESRPNVTADAAALCLKSANSCILRGGKEAMNSNLAIAAAFREAVASQDLPPECVTIVDNPDRAIVTEMCKAQGLIDLIIPRGGEGLIRAVTDAATIPVIKHFTGNCHIYVHSTANPHSAETIILNAKTQRPAVCNAVETLLVDRQIADSFLPRIAAKLKSAGVELRGCRRSRRLVQDIKPATDDDYRTEYLDLILAVKVVEDIDSAVEHINTYGSHHTDAIVTESLQAAEQFVALVDSSSVMVNASTRFSDGGEYGLGAEVGISTDKLHARGPMGAEDLTTYKWIVTGTGHIR